MITNRIQHVQEQHAGEDVCGLPGGCNLCDRLRAQQIARAAREQRIQAFRIKTRPAAERIAKIMAAHPDLFKIGGRP